MFAPKRSKLSEMSKDCAAMDTSIGRAKMFLTRSLEIALPLEHTVPEEFSITRNYPEKKWSADVSHIKYRLEKNKNIDSVQKEVLQRMFKFNQPYLQAVLDREVECVLHGMYLQTEPPHEMPLVSGCHMFGHAHTDLLVGMMMSELKLNETNVSGKCYLCMSVLLPELVAKMMMDMYKCTRVEAAQKMKVYSKQLTDSMMEKMFAF